MELNNKEKIIFSISACTLLAVSFYSFDNHLNNQKTFESQELIASQQKQLILSNDKQKQNVINLNKNLEKVEKLLPTLNNNLQIQKEQLYASNSYIKALEAFTYDKNELVISISSFINKEILSFEKKLKNIKLLHLETLEKNKQDYEKLFNEKKINTFKYNDSLEELINEHNKNIEKLKINHSNNLNKIISEHKEELLILSKENEKLLTNSISKIELSSKEKNIAISEENKKIITDLNKKIKFLSSDNIQRKSLVSIAEENNLILSNKLEKIEKENLNYIKKLLTKEQKIEDLKVDSKVQVLMIEKRIDEDKNKLKEEIFKLKSSIETLNLKNIKQRTDFKKKIDIEKMIFERKLLQSTAEAIDNDKSIKSLSKNKINDIIKLKNKEIEDIKNENSILISKLESEKLKIVQGFEEDFDLKNSKLNDKVFSLKKELKNKNKNISSLNSKLSNLVDKIDLQQSLIQELSIGEDLANTKHKKEISDLIKTNKSFKKDISNLKSNNNQLLEDFSNFKNKTALSLSKAKKVIEHYKKSNFELKEELIKNKEELKKVSEEIKNNKSYSFF